MTTIVLIIAWTVLLPVFIYFSAKLFRLNEEDAVNVEQLNASFLFLSISSFIFTVITVIIEVVKNNANLPNIPLALNIPLIAALLTSASSITLVVFPIGSKWADLKIPTIIFLLFALSIIFYLGAKVSWQFGLAFLVLNVMLLIFSDRRTLTKIKKEEV